MSLTPFCRFQIVEELLRVFIDDAAFRRAVLPIDETGEQGYLIVAVDGIPHRGGEDVDIAVGQHNLRRFPFEGGQWIKWPRPA